MTTVAKKPAAIDIRCPEPLRKLPNWLVWRFEQRPGESKPRKMPYYANGGRRKGAQGSHEDREGLVTADAAQAAASRRGFAGIGFAVLEGCGFDAVDFDDVVQDPGRFLEVRSMLAGTYAEFSPSGNGVRGFVRHTGEIRNLKSHAKEGHAYTFETFATAGFVTFTGDALPEVGLTAPFDDIAAPSAKLLALYRGRVAARGDAYSPGEGESGESMGYSTIDLETMLAALDPSIGYDTWINAGMALHHETGGSEEGFHLWDDWSSGGDNYVSTEDCLSHWSSFRRSSGRLVTIRSLMRQASQAGATVGAPVASPDDFEVVEDTPEEAAERKAKADRFAKVHISEILKRPRPTWLVDDLIPKADLIVVYGPSGSGKSFIMLDLAMSIARGVSWRGLDVQQGPVLYICAEGAGGFRNRIEAYARHHAIDTGQVPFWNIERAPNFLMADDVKAVLETAKAGQGSSVIFVDTFAKVTPGANENAGEDMGKAIDNCRKLADATGAVVVLIHHTGKDVERGARGWSGIRAAADAEFEVAHDKTIGKRWLENTKQKDGEDGGRWGFSLETVHIGQTDKGKDITSCVALDDEAPPVGRSQPKIERMSAWERTVLEAFTELQLGGDVLFTELVIRAAGKRPEGGSMRDRKKNVAKVIKKMATGPKAVFILGDDYVTEVQ